MRISVSFTAPATDIYGITIFNSGCIGTFYADDVQVEEAEAPSSYNLLENGNMETSGYGWTMGSGASYYSGKGVAASTNSIRINGNPTDQGTNAYQDVALNLPGTQTYVLSGWVNANAVPDDDQNTAKDLDSKTKECGLRAIITYSDNSTETQYVPFNSDLSNTWQFVSMTVVPKESTKTVSKIRVVCAYEGNANVAYFDNISLVRESAQTMKYDRDGNLVSVTTSGLKEDTSTYENGNLIKTVTGGNGTYKYTYDSTYKHRLTSVTNDLITQSVTYDSAGNAITTKLTGSGSKTISTAASYEGGLNRLASVTDAAGMKLTYGFGTKNAQMLALPTSITDPNGTVSFTSYDTNFRVSETGIENVANLLYSYDSGNLNAIKRTNDAAVEQIYSFTYDAFGNMTALKVGGKTLVSYTYGSGNGLLTNQVYANGDSVTFTYDKIGRTKTATYSDGRVLTYVYNGEGSLHSVTESNGSAVVTYLYTYDSVGRLISSEKRDNSTTTLRTHQTYNADNQLKKQGWQMGDISYSEEYTYNSTDGTLDIMRTGVGDELSMAYDELRRLSSVNGGHFNRTYTYRDISDTQTTMQVARLSYNLGSGLNYDYTYDNLGNIATYKKPDGEQITFTYDRQGQLLKAVGSSTYTYSYDSVGNVLTANGHSYSYSNADWKDLLTAYDGESITYDDSGNPTSYYNGTRWEMSWENGRSLSRAVSSDTVVDFTYDLSGIRSTKTIDGVQHSYLYAGEKLLRESYGSNVLDFFYDANGTPYALKYNGSIFYYITNLQGDVVQIVDTNGNTVANYEYDPYGKVISSIGAIAEVNPIRYRGYYYDKETELYYLQNRYFDPAVGRFINADSYASTGQSMIGHNMYAYCNNNPFCNVDASGTFFFTALGAVTGFISGALSAMATEEDSAKWFDIATRGAAGGAIAGAGVDAALLIMGIPGVGVPAVVGAFAIAYAAGGVGNVVTSYSTAKVCGSEYSSEQAIGMFIIGGTFNCLSLATGLSAASQSVGQLAFYGYQDLVENTVVGTTIGVTTGIATTVGTTSKPKTSKRNWRGPAKSSNRLSKMLEFKESVYFS